ncbi:MAG: DUF1460 domain-containing protein [Verrucomicrobiales bacterium]
MNPLPISRRRFAALALGSALCPRLAPASQQLPKSLTFKGESKFKAVAAKAVREGWGKLPIGERITKIAYELRGTPYKGYTLEIHDRVESPSCNFDGLDCWTFFESALGIARMIGRPQRSYSPDDLLREIEFTRYRGGACSGDYLDRIHYLAEWFFENEARGVADNLTRSLGGAERIRGRKIQEMTVLWKSYRYLKKNPSLLPGMKKQEQRVAALPVYYIPKSKASSAARKLQSGDVIGIVTRHDGGFCSHVGLAVRTGDGVLRLMHASTNYKRVVVDKSLAGYLNEFSSHAGFIAARPQELRETVLDPSQYRANLAKLTRG